ncbi:hypothetical protein C2E25_04500 [Geothermobacter hydrogeniphilus]|uniref:Transcriptional regulator, AbiEi antitoxin, Type IV TA system n=1 Tax=Geothermobacter hydrogeniphilus TaxID=1969733 RepID=A0A2K2HCM5_9BACT|nr:hypothetical protein [Geothermobacter hydrogeniphilus]PNU21065.1 hypothetical protein C2E25_04500 [Geothermobacter hydrogeniphilus]
MRIDDLRKKIPSEEFDYQSLMDALSGYAQPRGKISSLLAQGAIIRIKKGLYVFGPSCQRRPYSRELLANLIYGPSCVSLEFALHYHGLIPEKVEAVTSVTTKRPKKFQTPVGLFIYGKVPEAGFHIGIQRIEEDGRAFLIAAPEKALADKLRSDRGLNIRTQKECLEYLVSSLRIAESDLLKLNPGLLEKLGNAYNSKRISLLAQIIKRIQKRAGSNA